MLKKADEPRRAGDQEAGQPDQEPGTPPCHIVSRRHQCHQVGSWRPELYTGISVNRWVVGDQSSTPVSLLSGG